MTFLRLASDVVVKGVTLTKKAMKPYEQRLERSDKLPKWNVIIQPQQA